LAAEKIVEAELDEGKHAALIEKVIAEGVETKDQLNFLQDEGCDAVQGYWFSKPLPSDEYLQQ